MNKLGFYAIGFVFTGYVKSLITGAPVTSIMWIQRTNKDKKEENPKIYLPWVPELLGAFAIGGFLHYMHS